MYVKAENKSLILVSGSKNMKKEERNQCLQYVDFLSSFPYFMIVLFIHFFNCFFNFS